MREAAMDLPIECRTLAVMREARGWKKNHLAKALGMIPQTYYGYENGDVKPSRAFLERAAAAMALPAHHVDRTLAYLRQTDAAAAAGVAGAAVDARQAIDDLALVLGTEWGELHRVQLERSVRLTEALVERHAARLLFPRLRAYATPAEREAVVREQKAFQTWAVSELACSESIEAAAHDADEALDWARLAVLIAELATGDEAFLARSRGYALFHLGNATRVKGRLPEADVEFQRAKSLWEAGEAGDPEKLLDEARVLGMEASLRRDQRRLPEALDCLDRALAADRGGAETRYLLINRAKTLEELDDYEEAVATLRKALPLIDVEREPRLYWNLCFNLSENLFQVGQYDEVPPLLEEVQRLALRVGNGLGLVHLAWFRGRLAAGLGRNAEAEAAFEEVRQEFLARDIPFDTGLITLELAALFQEQGRTAEVKKLARELAPIFQEQRVSREALATLMLFREAVEQETLTVEMARRLLEDLRRARRRDDTALAELPDKGLGRRRQNRGRPGKPRPYQS